MPAPEAELLDLAVSDGMKGTGLAPMLFNAFAAETRKRGCRAFRITTGMELTRAHRFYEKMGAVRVGVMEIHRGKETVVYAFEDSRGRASDDEA